MPEFSFSIHPPTISFVTTAKSIGSEKCILPFLRSSLSRKSRYDSLNTSLSFIRILKIIFFENTKSALNLSKKDLLISALKSPRKRPKKSEITNMNITSLNEKHTPIKPRSLRSAPPNKPKTKSGNKINTGNTTEKNVPIRSDSRDMKNFWARRAAREIAINQLGILSFRISNRHAANKIRISKTIANHILLETYLIVR